MPFLLLLTLWYISKSEEFDGLDLSKLVFTIEIFICDMNVPELLHFVLCFAPAKILQSNSWNVVDAVWLGALYSTIPVLTCCDQCCFWFLVLYSTIQVHCFWFLVLKSTIQVLRPEWTSSHQCTSWPFCPLDALHFFIRRRMGFMTIHFFLLLTIVLFFFWFLVVFPWTWPHT